MLKTTIISLFFFLGIHANSQEKIAYDCKKINNKVVSVIVTPAAKPLPYLGKNVFISKYEINVEGQSIIKFFLYKFNNKQYILDGNNTKLNHTIDQVLFDLPQRNSYTIRLSGALAKLDLMLEKFYSINDEDFYIYKSTSTSGTTYEISKLIFDKRMIISELELKSATSSCTCTKKKIIIRLK
jgi:hypothetical protein